MGGMDWIVPAHVRNLGDLKAVYTLNPIFLFSSSLEEDLGIVRLNKGVSKM
jgi:hypothetical protein